MSDSASAAVDSVHVTVCICTYKRAALLTRCIESIQSQRVEEGMTHSVVVVDNDRERSAENSVSAFGDFARYVHEPRRGISHARNAALNHAAGDFVVLIDDDEWADEHWLAHLVETQRRYDADVVLGVVAPYADEGAPDWLRDERDNPWYRGRPATGTPLYEGNAGNALIRRSLVGDGGYRFDPAYGLTGGEDAVFFRMLADERRTIVACKEAIVYEFTPPERWQMDYLIRRNVLQGAGACRRFASLGRNMRFRALWLLKSFVAIPGCAIAALVCVIGSRRLARRYTLKSAYFLGYAAAQCGITLVRDRSNFERG